MNRLFAEAPPSTPATQTTSAAQRLASRENQLFSFFAPLHYEPNYAYPLLIWLHNRGGNQRQVQQVLPLVSTRNFVGVGVRGTADAGPGQDWRQTGEAILAAEQRIVDAVERARDRFHINSDRIFLAGYESGGTMALRIALRNPELFAAGLSIGGAFPKGHSPLVRVGELRKYPLFLAHARDSQTYPVDRVCQELRLLHAAGLGVTLRQYPCGDELTTQMLADMNAWLMEHVTGLPATEEADAAPLPSDWN